MARSPKMTDEQYAALIKEANRLALEAGQAWLDAAVARGPRYSVHQSDLAGNSGPAIDYLLDVCGNAHVRLRDRRSRFANYLKRTLGEGRTRYTITVPIDNPLRRRQEMGLAEAQAHAACNYLREQGIEGIYVWSYID